MLSTSDWVLIGSTLLLGAAAILAPYLSELLKRWLLAPKLSIDFRLAPPMCRRASRRIPADPSMREPFFDFHFQLTNIGKTKAREVEAILQELWVYDAAGSPQKLEDFSPVNFRYDATGGTFIHLNPHRPVTWNIGNIPSPRFQDRISPEAIVDVPGKEPGQLRFFFDLLDRPFFQPNSLLPGKYAIQIAIHSENASPLNAWFQVVWSGQWRDAEREMFRELVITRVDSI